MNIILVSLDQVDNVWPRVSGWVAKAIDKSLSNRTVIQTYAQCRNGSYWMAVITTGPEVADICGVAIMDLTEIDGETNCQFVVVGGEGDTDAWFELLIHWPWLKEMGVKVCLSEGRKGWYDRLKPLVPSIKLVRVVFQWRIDDLEPPH